jgi:hypothetical protein
MSVSWDRPAYRELLLRLKRDGAVSEVKTGPDEMKRLEPEPARKLATETGEPIRKRVVKALDKAG